jgi:hypothetical protein
VLEEKKNYFSPKNLQGFNSGLAKTRFFLKTQPGVFFGFYWVLLVFIGFYWFFWVFLNFRLFTDVFLPIFGLYKFFISKKYFK